VFFGDFSANIAMDQDYESTSNAPTAGEHPVALCHAGCALLMSWGSSLSGRVW
jgi:hypothetical protein